MSNLGDLLETLQKSQEEYENDPTITHHLASAETNIRDAMLIEKQLQAPPVLASKPPSDPDE